MATQEERIAGLEAEASSLRTDLEKLKKDFRIALDAIGIVQDQLNALKPPVIEGEIVAEEKTEAEKLRDRVKEQGKTLFDRFGPRGSRRYGGREERPKH